MKKSEEGDGQMMMCTPYMSNYYLCDFLKLIDNEKNLRKVMGQMMMCTSCMPRDMLMRTSILRLQSFLPLTYLALSHDHEHNN
jgi:hypothetical protein